MRVADDRVVSLAERDAQCLLSSAYEIRRSLLLHQRRVEHKRKPALLRHDVLEQLQARL